MDTSRFAFLIISRFEGCRLVPYRCPAGRWTIGYGATHLPDGKPVTAATDPLTPNEADGLLYADIRTLSQQIDRLTAGRDLTPWQTAALISFAYNVGMGALGTSTLLHMVLAGDVPRAADEFLRWDKMHLPSGEMVESRGLLARRKAERAMFLGEPFQP